MMTIVEETGHTLFGDNCAACHGLDGQGSERGPDIANRRVVQQRTNQALAIPQLSSDNFRSFIKTFQ